MTIPTTAAVPSTSPLDFLFNAEKLDEAINTGALTYLDRFGAQRKTLAGAMASISAVNPRGAWVTATAYAARDVVSNSGTWYIALDNHTSGATFAGDQTAHWRVYQGVISSDLSSTASASLGAGMEGFNPALAYGSGTTGKAIKVRRISPKDHPYNATADGTTDDTAAVTACLNAHLYVDFGDASNVYKVSAALPLRTGHDLIGGWAEVKQVTANTETFNYESRSNIRVRGLIGRGVGTDFTDSDSSRAAFMYGGTSGSDIEVVGCKLYAFSYTTVRARNNARVKFLYNFVEGPGSPTLTSVTSGRCYAFLADAGCSDIDVVGNSMSKTAQGVRIEQCTDTDICGNRIFDIVGQHGIYAGSGLAGLTIRGNRIRNTDLCGIKVQAADAALVDNTDINILGNLVYDAGDQGILVCNAAGAATYKCRGVVVAGNVVRLTSTNGIYIDNTINGSVYDNIISSCGQSGIALDESSDITVAINKINGTTLSAIRDIAANTDIRLLSNKIADCCTASTPGDRFGIFIQGGSEIEMGGNMVSDSAAKMEYGIYVAGGTQTTFSVYGNEVKNATGTGARFISGQSMRRYEDNNFSGTGGAVTNDPVPPTIASASTIALPQGWKVCFLSGTATINTITPNGHSGRTVVLVAAPTATPTLATGTGNLKIGSNFAMTADDTFMGSCDGVTWWQNSRSVN